MSNNHCIIVLSQREAYVPEYGEQRDALSREWPPFLSRALPGVLPVPMVNHPPSVHRLLEGLRPSGVILTGGGTWGEDVDRDETEAALVAYCRKNTIPLMGVCRGMQVINLLLGGAQAAPIPLKEGRAPHVARDHALTLDPSARHGDGSQKPVAVNSYHNLGLRQEDLAPGLVAFATAEDGIVEGFRHPREPILAIQWHPERPGSDEDFTLGLVATFFTTGCTE